MLEDSGMSSLRSKISHANSKTVMPVENTEVSRTPACAGPAPCIDNSGKLPPDLKGKASACASPCSDNSGKHVELGSIYARPINEFISYRGDSDLR